MQDITVSLGGRVAEELIFDDITTGASQDIKQATAYAKSMVTKFGMSEALGLVQAMEMIMMKYLSEEILVIPPEVMVNRLPQRSTVK